MSALTPQEFERALRGLDRETVVSLVAALWAARGWETTVEGATVVASRGTPAEERVLWVRHDAPRLQLRGGGAPPDGVDAVVTSAAGSRRARRRARECDADLVDATDLHEALLYGVGRERAERLCERHLGRPLSAPPEAQTGGLRERLAENPRWLASAALALLAALAIVVAGGPVSPGQPAAETTTTTGERLEVAALETTATFLETRTTENDRDGAVEIPAGHAAVLANASFAVTEVEAVRYANGSLYSRFSLAGAFAANRTRYAITLNRSGPGTWGFDRGVQWAGNGHVLRATTTGNTTSYAVLHGVRQRLVRPQEALFLNPIHPGDLPELLAAVDEADVAIAERDPDIEDQQWAPLTLDNLVGRHDADGPLVFSVTADLHDGIVGHLESDEPVDDATLAAVLDSRGFVYSYTLQYETRRDGRPLRVSRRVSFDAVGNTTVNRPEWYRAALQGGRVTPRELSFGGD